MKPIRTLCCFEWALILQMCMMYDVDPYDFTHDNSFKYDVYYNETDEYVDMYIEVTNVKFPDIFTMNVFAVGIAQMYCQLKGWRIDMAYASLPCGQYSQSDIERIEWFSQ